MSERGPTIGFRLDQDDYERFAEYVESSRFKQSQIVEHAVINYLDKQYATFTDKLRTSAGIGVIAVTCGYYGATGNPISLTIAVILFMSLPFILPILAEFVSWAEGD